MADVLAQSEVDALLAAVNGGGVTSQRSDYRLFSRHRRTLEGVEVRDYDFKRPERVSKDQMLAIQTLHETFARNFGAALSGFLRSIVEVKVATCEQMTYSEFIAGLPNPSCFNLLEADGLDGQLCLDISPLVIYPIIDRLLGGGNQDLFIPHRPMTSIEARLISNVTQRGLSALTEAWSGIRHLEFSVASTESNPQLVQIVPPDEVVVVVGFEIKLVNRAGTMNLCLPYNTIEAVMEQLAAQSWFSASKSAKTDETSKRISQGLSRAGLEVSGILANTTISLADLAGMAPGDLIVTNRRSNQPAVITVGGEAKFLAEIGQHRGQRALRVVRPVTPEDRF